MEKILIVSKSLKSKEIMSNIINENGRYNIETVTSSEQCKKIINHTIFDLILINTPLKNESEEELCLFLSKNTNSYIILIVHNSTSRNVSNQIREEGIVIIEKPLNKFILMNTINVSIIYRKKLQKYINENEELKNKIKDLKIIDRAKYTLMEYLRMSESEAHKYIEKQAMDLRIKKIDICNNILKMYES